MKDDLSRRLSVDPNFKALVRERFKLRLILSVIAEVLVATTFIGLFYTFLFLLGFGAVVVLRGDPTTREAVQNARGNMVALYLANALGGPVLFGFISGVAFSTILAVVSGLTTAGASAISHDLYASVLRGGKANDNEEVVVLRLAACAFGIVSVTIGLLFEQVVSSFDHSQTAQLERAAFDAQFVRGAGSASKCGGSRSLTRTRLSLSMHAFVG